MVPLSIGEEKPELRDRESRNVTVELADSLCGSSQKTFSESIKIVTGPSFINQTCIMA